MRCVIGISPSLRQLAARILLATLSVAAVGPIVHGAHDEDCDPVIVAHDASQHRVQAPLPLQGELPSGEHCLACHFARASRGAAAWEPTGLIHLAAGVLLFHRDGQLIAAPDASPLPARAPPAPVAAGL